MGCQTQRFVYEYVLEHYGDDGDHVDGTARFDNGEFRLNGDFFALSSVREQSAEVVTTGAFNFTSDRDGNFSGYFNGRSALEVQLAHDMVLDISLGLKLAVQNCLEHLPGGRIVTV